MTTMTAAQNVTPITGGKVHLPNLHVQDVFPDCRMGRNMARTRFVFTDAPVDCENCLEQLRLRALRDAQA